MIKRIIEACIKTNSGKLSSVFYRLLAVYLIQSKEGAKDKYYTCLRSASMENRELFLDELIERSAETYKYKLSESTVGLLVLAFQ